ncbi:unnamed protein product [Pleuronectes platessa]|uniref:Uncharacterized protein n=1 Tax=Pleuronectes platessa TaxID=8262 RepID=A0A9N7YD99_PLEPL|nr:unnamed protein product [Pleuronectes platessa]
MEGFGSSRGRSGFCPVAVALGLLEEEEEEEQEMTRRGTRGLEVALTQILAFTPQRCVEEMDFCAAGVGHSPTPALTSDSSAARQAGETLLSGSHRVEQMKEPLKGLCRENESVSGRAYQSSGAAFSPVLCCRMRGFALMELAAHGGASGLRLLPGHCRRLRGPCGCSVFLWSDSPYFTLSALRAMSAASLRHSWRANLPGAPPAGGDKGRAGYHTAEVL